MDQQLYEQLNIAIYNGINEAYNNMLFEEFDFRQVFDTAVSKTKKAVNAAKDMATNAKVDIAYKYVKKYIAKLIDEISKVKGKEAAQQYVKSLKAKTIEIMKECDITPQQVKAAAKILAVGIIGVTSCAIIQKNVANDMPKDEIEEIPFMLKYDRDYFESTNKDNVDLLHAFDATVTPELFDRTVVLPTEVLEQGVQMTPTKDCINFIKNEEKLRLTPYYAVESEKNKRKITIGYGHVITWFSNGIRHWAFPSSISEQRQEEIKKDILYYEKKKCIDIFLSKKIANDVITKEEAEAFLEYDLNIADTRVKKTLGILSCNSEDYNVKGLIDENVGAYCYYNQNIYDMLVSCIINTGVLPNNSSFSKRLQNCKFDKKFNMVDNEDFAFTFNAFKNLSNSKRRQKEYEHFKMNDKDILTHFNIIKNKGKF